ncbi:hypothetical protein [Ruthenibacterium lactatiformans]|uniref:hypothetical protein n=1 Tax=Ruthenibacterium lactatiformans TaxID=1550024 RepID=UPI0019680E0E|nr:hypothetical protein [Ruthenibacterium lactatiformans]MBN3008162.1 hypothetical protein [Ruthenibacterium lactatiformans]
MSVTYGFYNSIKGDRKYNALEMSSIFDGIIVDGVYMSIGDALNVKSSGGMGITVGIGRAWFNHTWTLNDSLLPLTLANSDVLLNRIDAIVLEVNNNTEVRKNTIKILKGTPSSKPVKPTMTEGELLNQHPLAYISIPAGATSISQSNIENAVGTSACPYVTGVLKGMDIDKLVAQWGAQWAEWLSSNTDAWKAFMSDNTNEWKSFMAKNKNEWSALINGNTSEFETWFEHMKDQLSEDAAGNLQLQVDNLNNAALGGDFVLKGSPVSVEYMGANRIASITAYGETPQGGTTEAPVALTGVDSVFVGGRNLLPHVEKSATMRGVTIISEKDGYILDGTATGYVYFDVSNVTIPAGNYVLSAFSGSTEVGVRIRIDDSRSVQVCGKETISFDYTGGTLKVEIIVRTPSSVLDNIFIAAQINLGSVALPYEPYQGSLTTLPIPRPLHEVGDVRDVCRTRVKSVYDKRIVLDGTESWKIGSAVGDGAPYIVCDLLSDHYQSDPIVSSRIPYTSISASNKKQGIGGWNRSLYLRYDSLFTNVEELKTYLSAHPLTVYYQSTAYDGTNGLDICLTGYQTGYIESYADESITTAWISSTGALSTGAEVAYVLSSPETYATDPVDFDNTAGPLTVLTGGEVEVRMTELIGSRTYDADGDGVVDKAAAVPWDGVTGKPGAFTPSAHTHDDRYYTETEMNTKLNGKANSSHTHTKDQVGLSKVNNNSISMGLSGTDLWVYYS